MHNSWTEESRNPVSTLAINLQRLGYKTDVLVCDLEKPLHKDEYLLRFWTEEDGEDIEPAWVLMGDLGVTWEPYKASATEELATVSLADDVGEEANRLHAILSKRC